MTLIALATAHLVGPTDEDNHISYILTVSPQDKSLPERLCVIDTGSVWKELAWIGRYNPIDKGGVWLSREHKEAYAYLSAFHDSPIKEVKRRKDGAALHFYIDESIQPPYKLHWRVYDRPPGPSNVYSYDQTPVLWVFATRFLQRWAAELFAAAAILVQTKA